MKNRHGLPLPLVKAIDFTSGEYVRHGDFSVTELFDPPRKTALLRKHPEVYEEEDVIDHLWALFGTAVHEKIERGVGATRILEQHREGFLLLPEWGTKFRLFMDFDGTMVSGGPDLYHVKERTLYDFKVTKVYATKNGPKLEWKQQLQTYACMMPRNGWPVPKRLVSVVILKDFVDKQAVRQDYPDCPVVMFDVEILECESVMDMVRERVRLHQAARSALAANEEPVECTDYERWHVPGKVAVMKRGQKRAVKLFDSAAEAEAYMPSVKGSTYLVARPSEERRCERYCLAESVCSQWKAIRQRNDDLRQAGS